MHGGENMQFRPTSFIVLIFDLFCSKWHKKHVFQQLRPWSLWRYKNYVHTLSNWRKMTCQSWITFFLYTLYNSHSILRHINPLENSPHRVKCHKIVMIYPQPIRGHCHPNVRTLITLAPISYLRSLVVRAVHRHRTGVRSIPAGGPYSWWIFLVRISTCV